MSHNLNEINQSEIDLLIAEGQHDEQQHYFEIEGTEQISESGIIVYYSCTDCGEQIDHIEEID